MIYGRSLGKNFQMSHWYREVFPANHFHLLENEKEIKTQDTSSHLSLMESNDADRDLFSWKMSKEFFQASLLEKDGLTRPELQFCSMSSENWNEWVIEQRQEYSARLKSAHRTKESGSSSWPTTAARDYKGESGSGRQERKGHPADTLPNAVAQWLTPTAGECLDQGTNWETLARLDKGGRILRRMASLEMSGPHAPANHNTHGSRPESWATPQASDHVEGARTELTSNQKCLGRDMKQWANPSAAKLNQRWVETLMGLPMGWTSPSCPASVILNWPKFVSGWLNATTAQTNYDPAEMELFQLQQNERSES
jgi:hypothetical protein